MKRLVGLLGFIAIGVFAAAIVLATVVDVFDAITMTAEKPSDQGLRVGIFLGVAIRLAFGVWVVVQAGGRLARWLGMEKGGGWPPSALVEWSTLAFAATSGCMGMTLALAQVIPRETPVPALGTFGTTCVLVLVACLVLDTGLLPLASLLIQRRIDPTGARRWWLILACIPGLRAPVAYIHFRPICERTGTELKSLNVWFGCYAATGLVLIAVGLLSLFGQHAVADTIEELAVATLSVMWIAIGHTAFDLYFGLRKMPERQPSGSA